MCSLGVLIHCPSSLGAAAAVSAAEFRRGDGVFATLARERDQAVHHLDGVMSHSFNSSPLSRYDSEPKLLRVESASTSVRTSRFDHSVFILCKRGDGNRMRFRSPLTLHLCRTGYNIFRLPGGRRHKASERISIEF